MIVCDFHVHLGKSRDGASLKSSELLRQMRICGVKHAVVFPIDEPEVGLTYEPQNRKILKEARSHQQFIPFCRLNPGNLKAALTELRFCFNSGFKGLKLHPRSEKIAYNSIDPILEEVASYGWPVLMHSSHEKNCRPRFWERTFKRFRKTIFILGHGGKDSYEEAVEVVKHLSNVYLETSTLSYNRTKVILKSVGAKRMLFASDIPYSHMFLERRKLELLANKSELRAIFRENPYRVLSNIL